MNWGEVLQIAGTIAVLGVALGAGVGGFWYAFKSKDNKLLHEQINQNKKDIANCESKHAESDKAVANLQGQIDVLKNVPLANIATNMEKLATSNLEILTTLRSSAIIAATDRDTLLGSSHISEQHVEHQHVEKETVRRKG